MNWAKIDKKLDIYLKKYKNKQENLKDRIQAIFDLGFTDLGKTANNNDLNRFKRFLEQNEELVKENDYIAYLVLKYKKKSKVLYKDIINVMILVEYAKFEREIGQEQIDTLININKEQFEDTINKCEKLGFKKPKRMNWTDSILLALLLTPNNTGLTFKEQNDSASIYNAGETYKQAVVDISQGKKPNVFSNIYKNIFERQQKRDINKKTTPSQDKFSGIVDNENTFLLNQINLEIYKYYGVEMVIFRTIHDSRRTLMCTTLNNQKFYINKMNAYDRYSKEDDRNVVYHTQGLVVGENLPPIVNGFHWCRSWIDPYKE